MRRRDFVRGAVAASIAPTAFLGQQSGGPTPPLPAPVPWTLGLNPKTPVPKTTPPDGVAEPDTTFFTAAQLATLTQLSAVLLPPSTHHAGAIEAETPAFLDFLIGHSPDTRRDLYTHGLDWLESQAKLNYAKPFAQLDPVQVDAIIKPWLRTWMSDHPPTAPHADFINIAHADIRTATANSKAWAAKSGGNDPSAYGLYWSPIDPDIYAQHPDAVHTRPSHVIAAPRASHTQRSYPQ